MNIRPLGREDLPALKAVVDRTGLFPSDLLDQMAASALSDPEGPDIWLTGHLSTPVALAYVAPEKMAEGVWNLLLIAVDPTVQGRGHGSAMLDHIEGLLARRGQRMLIVETSGLPEFSGTRAFYAARGYGKEGRIRDYYQPGDDKVIYRKGLRP